MADEKRVQELRQEFLCSLHAATESGTHAEREFYWFAHDDKMMEVGWAEDHPQKVAYNAKANVRQACTLGRFIRRRWDKSHAMTDQGIERLVGKTLAMRNSLDDHIRLVSGDSIIDAYEEEWGGHSCMTGECSKYTEFYANNNVDLLLYELGDTLARMLVWHTDQGDVACDRIYPNSGQHIASIERYARSKGWAIRSGYGLPSPIAKFEDNKPRSVTVTADGYWPYLDTFRFVQQKEDTEYVLFNQPGPGEAYNLSDGTEGYLSSRFVSICKTCSDVKYGDFSHRAVDDSVREAGIKLRDYCNDCVGNVLAWIPQERVWTLQENIRYANDIGMYVRKDNSTYTLKQCEACEQWYAKDINQNVRKSTGGTLCYSCYSTSPKRVRDDVIVTEETKEHLKRNGW